MLLTQFTAAVAALPLLVAAQPAISQPAISQPAINIAQANDPYADWVYLYEDTFEDSTGGQVTQQWWLSPDTIQRSGQLTFTLLARRSPAGANGTAAALFDYIANCEGMMYSIERTAFLDANNQTLDVQTYQRPMDAADANSAFYSVLNNVCAGNY
ncbi:MAG: hypothetical protein AAGF98_15475 [Cyanobacteria bacterium P01_H01_bin.153]